MTTDLIEVSEHGTLKKFWFNPNTGEVTKQDPLKQPSDLPAYGSIERAACFRGSFKRFLLGGTVFRFRDGDDYFLQYGKLRWNISDPGLFISRKRFGPFLLFSISSADFKRSFLDLMLGAEAQKALDPTYDKLDQLMDDFTAGVFGQYRKRRSKFSS